MSTPPDDLGPLLHPTPRDAPDALRGELLRRTTATLRRRVLVRRLAVGAGAVAVFAIGAGCGWVFKPRPEPEVVYLPAPVPPADPPPAPVPPPNPSAGEIELRAELSDDPDEVARLYREAGDQYLTAEKDYAQAARCYRLHLNVAGTEGRKVSVRDSWLLMSMKGPIPSTREETHE